MSACRANLGMALLSTGTSTRMLSICDCMAVMAAGIPEMNDISGPGVVSKRLRSPFVSEVREPSLSEREVSVMGEPGSMVMPGSCHLSELMSALTSMPCVAIL